MRNGLIKLLSTSFALVFITVLALWSAQSKMHDLSAVDELKVDMAVTDLEFLGQPIEASASELTYLLPNGSTLKILTRNGRVETAWLLLKNPMKVEDSWFRDRTFVRLSMDEAQNPSWFFAGAPEEGRIFKISQQGFVEGLSWVRPFTGIGPSRELQALHRQFRGERLFSL